MRGPKLLTAIESTRRATEKMRASTVLTAPSIAPRMARASSGPPTEIQRGRRTTPRAASRSTVTVRMKSSTAARHMVKGTRHRSARSCRTSPWCLRLGIGMAWAALVNTGATALSSLVGGDGGQVPIIPRFMALSVLLGHVLVGVVRLAVIAALLPIGQLHLRLRGRLVVDAVEQMGDDVQPGATLVVR